ncbi:MAG: hypothetical protein CSA49_01675 [Gammaproteobacteria bacterium]|nr:MAG: hypothetical protein CSA49_01675 [Gammaproteobacteria bacterium]
MYRVIVISALLLMACSARAHLPADVNIGSPEPFENWKTLETAHFRINFQARHLAFAQRMAAIAENVYDKTTRWMAWHPRDVTEIIINDTFDESNGGASPLPYNRFFISMNAPIEGQLVDNSPWMELVFTHEFIHILHLDQASGLPDQLRRIFGRVFFSFPQIFSPKWLTEGLAVYGETDKAAGFGRGRGAMYAGMMRAEVIKGMRSLTQLSYQGYHGTDWPLGQVYLYGYYFFEFVEAEYGQQTLNAYVKNWNNNLIPWRLDSRSKEVFGVSAETLWSQFQTYTNKKFQPTIAKIKANGVQPSQAIAVKPVVNANPVWMPDGDMYFYHNNGHDHARIELRKADGSLKTVTQVKGFSMFDVHAKKGLLLSRAAICDNTRLYTDLYIQAPGQTEWRRITECGRYPRAFWSPDGKFIVAVKVGDGQTSLVLLDLAGKELALLDKLGLGEAIGHFHWAGNGRAVVAAIKREKTGWNLEEYDLYKRTWKPLTHNQHIEYHPTYSADGKSIYFVSDQGNALNIRRLDRATGKITTLTNTLTAILDFSPNQTGDAFRAVEYTAEGLVINEVQINQTFATYNARVDVQQQPEQAPAVASFSNSADYDPSAFSSVKNYSPWDSLQPRSWWAWWTIDGANNGSVQLVMDGSDALNFHYWQAAPQFYYDKKLWGGEFAYTFYNRLTLLASRKVDIEQEEDIDNNLFEEWDREDRYQAIYSQPINSLETRMQMNVGIAQERVERTFEINGNKTDGENNLLGILFNWNNTDSFLHSISPENGRDVTLTVEKYSVFGGGINNGFVSALDWREFISLPNNHVLGMRFVYAKSDGGDTEKTLKIGGNFDNYSSLAATIGFGVDKYMLRGYSDNAPQLQGDTVNVNTLEWRIPMSEWFDGLMLPPLGFGKSSLTLFMDTGAAWFNADGKDYYSSLGFEINPQLLIGYDTFAFTASIGIAHGLDNELGGTEAYFRLLTSF